MARARRVRWFRDGHNTPAGGPSLLDHGDTWLAGGGLAGHKGSIGLGQMCDVLPS
jgi:hypothetical protein